MFKLGGEQVLPKSKETIYHVQEHICHLDRGAFFCVSLTVQVPKLIFVSDDLPGPGVVILTPISRV